MTEIFQYAGSSDEVKEEKRNSRVTISNFNKYLFYAIVIISINFFFINAYGSEKIFSKGTFAPYVFKNYVEKQILDSLQKNKLNDKGIIAKNSQNQISTNNVADLQKNNGTKIWYVRPINAPIHIGNGKSYETAWRGFKRIVWGNKGVKPGDTLMVCGIHRQRLNIGVSGKKGKKIIISGEYVGDPGGISRSKGHCIFFEKKNYLEFKKLKLSGSKVGIASYSGCNNIIVNNCSFSDFKLKGLHLYSRDPGYYVENILVKNCKFSNIGDWGNSGANSLTYAGYSRNTITENCYFEGDGREKGVDGILIQNIVGNGSNHVIRHCVFTGHEENSIDLKHVVESPLQEGSTKIYNNDFSKSNQLEIVLHWGTQGVNIFRNTFHDGNLGIGIVRHNKILNNNGNIIVTYNIFENLQSGLLMDSFSDGIGNSTFVNNTCKNIGANNKKNYSIQIATNNWIIKNNIFFLLSKSKPPFCSIRFLSNVDMKTIDLDHNYHFLVKGKKVYRLPGNSKYLTIKQAEKNGIQGEKLSINTGADDFSTSVLRACINKGLVIEDVHPTVDIFGNQVPKCGLPDIGAYESDCSE